MHHPHTSSPLHFTPPGPRYPNVPWPSSLPSEPPGVVASEPVPSRADTVLMFVHTGSSLMKARARDGVALAAGFGHEAHARTGDLVGVHLLFRVHALTVADAGVIERAQPVHMHRTARVHQVAHYDAQGLNGGLGVGDADGRHAGDVLAQFVHLYGRTHGDGLRVPLLGQLLVNCFEYRHRCKNLS